MFYFHSIDGSTVGTRKRLCVFGRRTRTRTLCIRRTLCRYMTIGTPIVIFAVLTIFDCFWRLVHCWYTVGTVLVNLWRLVHQWFWVFLTTGTVYHSSKNSQKTVKTAKMTIGVPIVTCLPRLRQQCTNRQKQSKDSQNRKNEGLKLRG